MPYAAYYVNYVIDPRTPPGPWKAPRSRQSRAIVRSGNAKQRSQSHRTTTALQVHQQKCQTSVRLRESSCGIVGRMHVCERAPAPAKSWRICETPASAQCDLQTLFGPFDALPPRSLADGRVNGITRVLPFLDRFAGILIPVVTIPLLSGGHPKGHRSQAVLILTLVQFKCG